jgi:hypothetical protein
MLKTVSEVISSAALEECEEVCKRVLSSDSPCGVGGLNTRDAVMGEVTAGRADDGCETFSSLLTEANCELEVSFITAEDGTSIRASETSGLARDPIK